MNDGGKKVYSLDETILNKSRKKFILPSFLKKIFFQKKNIQQNLTIFYHGATAFGLMTFRLMAVSKMKK